MARNELIDDPGTLRPLVRLATPVLAGQILHVLVGYSETILAGQYFGQDELAAMGMMNYILWLTYTMFELVGVGAVAVTARCIGAGDRPTAQRVLHQSLLLGAGLTVIVMTLGYLGKEWFVELLNLRGASAELAARYLAIFFVALPAVMIEEVGIACLRAAGDTVSGLVAMAAVNVVNIAVSWSLVLGVGPLPPWGWDALPLGAACGSVVGALIIVAALRRGRGGLCLRWDMLRFDAGLARRILRVGIPGGADLLAVVCCHLWYVTIINGLGPLATAAHGVGVRIESLSYLPGYAFQVAAQALVGQYLGARDSRRAARVVWHALGTGLCVMGGAGLVLFFYPESITRLFVRAEQADVIALTARLLPIVAVSMPALALISVLSGALRGAGDTRITLIFTFVGLLLVRIPGTYWLAYDVLPLDGRDTALTGWNLGVAGAWYAMVADVTIRCLFFAARFFQGGWKRIRV